MDIIDRLDEICENIRTVEESILHITDANAIENSIVSDLMYLYHLVMNDCAMELQEIHNEMCEIEKNFQNATLHLVEREL